MENRVSSKGNSYQTILFSQGTSTLTCMLKADNLGNLELYKPYSFTLDYNTRYKEFRCVGIEVVKAGGK